MAHGTARWEAPVSLLRWAVTVDPYGPDEETQEYAWRRVMRDVIPDSAD